MIEIDTFLVGIVAISIVLAVDAVPGAALEGVPGGSLHRDADTQGIVLDGTDDGTQLEVDAKARHVLVIVEAVVLDGMRKVAIAELRVSGVLVVVEIIASDGNTPIVAVKDVA